MSDDRPFQVQRGELPAENIRELVDAQRQNLCAAGFDFCSLELMLSRALVVAESDPRITVMFQVGDWERIKEALADLRKHVEHIDAKATLAFNHYCEGDDREMVHQ